MSGFGAKVKLSVDSSSVASKEFKEQIKSIIGKIDVSDKLTVSKAEKLAAAVQDELNKKEFKIKIKQIDCTAAVKDLQTQLQNMINSLSIKNKINITGLKDPTGAGAMGTNIKNAAKEAAAGAKEVERMTGQTQLLGEVIKSLKGGYRSVMPSGANPMDGKEFAEITARYEKIKGSYAGFLSMIKEGRVEQAEKVAAVIQEAIETDKLIAKKQKQAQAEAAAARQAKEKADAAEKEAARMQKQEEKAAKRMSPESLRVKGRLQIAGQAMSSVASARNRMAPGGSAEISPANLDPITQEYLRLKAIFDQLNEAKRQGQAVDEKEIANLEEQINLLRKYVAAKEEERKAEEAAAKASAKQQKKQRESVIKTSPEYVSQSEDLKAMEHMMRSIESARYRMSPGGKNEVSEADLDPITKEYLRLRTSLEKLNEAKRQGQIVDQGVRESLMEQIRLLSQYAAAKEKERVAEEAAAKATAKQNAEQRKYRVKVSPEYTQMAGELKATEQIMQKVSSMYKAIPGAGDLTGTNGTVKLIDQYTRLQAEIVRVSEAKKKGEIVDASVTRGLHEEAAALRDLLAEKQKEIRVTEQAAKEKEKENKRQVKVSVKTSPAYAQTKTELDAARDVLNKIRTMYNKLPTGVEATAGTTGTESIREQYERLRTTYNQLAEQKKNGISVDQQKIQAIRDEATALRDLLTAMGDERSAQARANKEAEKAAKAEAEKAAMEAKPINELGYEKQVAMIKKVEEALKRAKKAEEDWTKARHKTPKLYEDLKKNVRELEDLYSKTVSGDISIADMVDDDGKPVEGYRSKLERLNKEFRELKTGIEGADAANKSFGSRFAGLAAKFSTWLSVSQIIMTIVRGIKQMVSAVVEADAAMTELRKVTNATADQYTLFLDKASDRARQFGATLTDTISATADFARLGYSLSEATDIADAALVYKNVGDGIETINDASESIIATMQVFGKEVGGAMDIVDKFNLVGNNYAISAKGVGDAMLRSAAAMGAANNTLDETIALAAAANTVVQDPEKVGTTLKTVSMYLRAAKTEAEDAGESTDGMAESVSKLRGEILALTGNKVDIQIDEDTFKSTYQIMKELSQIWDELTDVSQANVLNLVGGKRNANVVAAILENFDVASRALETSMGAEGSALKENEIYLDSIAGKIAKFKTEFQDLAQDLIGSDIVKTVVDIGTGLIKILDSIVLITDRLGGLKTVLTAIAGISLAKNLGAIGEMISVTRKKYREIFVDDEKDKKDDKPVYVPKHLKKDKETDDKSDLGSAKEIDRTASAFIRAKRAVREYENSAKGSVTTIGKMKAAFGGLTAGMSALQIAIGGVTIALTAAIAIYSAVKKHNEEMRLQAVEQAEAYSEGRKTLEEYKSEFESLRKSLDEGNLSQAEAYSARSRLVEIEKELIDLFGKEAKGIDLVTGSIEGQIDAINGLSEAEFEAYKQRNAGKIEDAKTVIGSPTGDAINMFAYATNGTPLAKEVRKAVKEAGFAVTDGPLGSTKIAYEYDNIYEQIAQYEKLYNVLEQIGKMYAVTNELGQECLW